MRFAKQIQGGRQSRRQGEEREDKQRARGPEFGEQEPVAEQQEQQGGRHQAAPEIVENLPQREAGKGIGIRRAVVPRDTAAGAIGRSASRRESSGVAG